MFTKSKTFGNCGFDNAEISVAFIVCSVPTLTPVWYYTTVTQQLYCAAALYPNISKE